MRWRPRAREIWLDGGHNPDGSRAIAAALADLEERVARPFVLIVGMLETKDCEGFLRNFIGLAHRLFAVPIPHQEKSLAPPTLAATAQRLGIAAESLCERRGRLCRNEAACARSAAAHSHHRLALSRRRGAEGERNVAGIELPRHFSNFIKSAFFCFT